MIKAYRPLCKVSGVLVRL